MSGNDILDRRQFISGCLATAAARCVADVASHEAGATLPAWKPGELELHFIYTG